jgi:quercetin dioxygenase-like cupin family protein
MRVASVLILSIMMTACAAPSAGRQVEMDSPAASVATKVTPIVRTGKTISGQPLKLPQGPAEMVAASVDIPAGGRIALHRHPWSRFVYVERGRLSIANRDTGEDTVASAGQVIAEVVSQWHEAVALDGAPARLVVIDVVPPSVVNMEMPPH